MNRRHLLKLLLGLPLVRLVDFSTPANEFWEKPKIRLFTDIEKFYDACALANTDNPVMVDSHIVKPIVIYHDPGGYIVPPDIAEKLIDWAYGRRNDI